MPRQPLLCVYWLPKHSVFWFIPLFKHSHSGHLWLLLLTLQHMCDLQDAMQRQRSPALPTHPLLQVLLI